jgi:hypothetical protein
MQSFLLCSRELMMVAAAQSYDPAGSRATGERFAGSADMPAYIHPHDEIEPAFVICPICVGLPMYVREVEPHWSMAKIDFTYECADCGAEVRETVVKPELQH